MIRATWTETGADIDEICARVAATGIAFLGEGWLGRYRLDIDAHPFLVQGAGQIHAWEAEVTVTERPAP